MSAIAAFLGALVGSALGAGIAHGLSILSIVKKLKDEFFPPASPPAA